LEGLVADANSRVRDLWGNHHKAIVGMLTRKTRNLAIAEDLAQDVWLKVIELSSEKQDELNGPFLKKMAVNRFIDVFRKVIRREVSLEAPPDEDVDEKTARSFREALIAFVCPTELAKLEFYEEAWSAFIEDKGPPHQTVVFSFNMILQWKPDDIRQKLSPHCLDGLEEQLEGDVSAAYTLQKGTVWQRFEGLRNRLSLPVCWKHVKADRAGNTELKCYYDPTKPEPRSQRRDIVHWTDNVKRRLRNAGFFETN
jgi:DNA-directed RNA polymerase specialized sigma24 family protein